MATTDGNTNLPLFQINDPDKVIRLGLAGLELNNVPADTAFAVSHDGLGIQYDITGVKKTFTISPNGVSWSDGTQTNTTGLERLSLVQQAFQAVNLPPNSTTLQIDNTLFLTNGSTTDTATASYNGVEVKYDNNVNFYQRSSNTSGQVLVEYTDYNTSAQYLAELTNGAGVVLTNGGLGSGNARIQTAITSTSSETQINCQDTNSITPVPLNVIASSLLLNGTPVGGGGSQNLSQVLSVGNDAGNQDITGVQTITTGGCNTDILSSKSGGAITMYQPFGSLSLANDMNANGYNILNVNNINTATINGLSPTTIGLNWGDFAGNTAYNNLPSQSYQVSQAGTTTSQAYDRFMLNDNNNYLVQLDENALTFTYVPSTTITSYSSTGQISTNNTDIITITAGASSNYNINLNCSQLLLNGNPLNPTILQKQFYSNASTSFSIGAGSWYNVGVGSSPIFYISGLTPYTTYTFTINFSCYTNVNEPTGACYLGFSNDTGGYSMFVFNNNNPCASIGSNSTFYSQTTQFIMSGDTLTFNSGMSGAIGADLYFGHNGGTWSGNYYWSVNGIQVI